MTLPKIAQILQEAWRKISDSAVSVKRITPGTALDKPTRAIYVGVSGDATLTFVDGTKEEFKGLPIGTHPFSIVNVDSGATATHINALY